MRKPLQVCNSLPDALGAAAEHADRTGLGLVLERGSAAQGYEYGASEDGRDSEEIAAGWVIAYRVKAG